MPRNHRKALLFWSRVALAVAAMGLGYYVYARYFMGNFGVVRPGQVYRSAQPAPWQLDRWTRQHGLRTVVNLRGPSSKRTDYVEESNLTRRLGVTLIDHEMASGRLPSAGELRGLIRVLETAERPMLIHCRDGADRTGLASTLVQLMHEVPYEQAKNEFTVVHWHFDRGSAHGEDARIQHVLSLYEDYCRTHDEPIAGWQHFRWWAMNIYTSEHDTPEDRQVQVTRTAAP